jgi:phosphoribosyl-ATP pyrophosphohydrolase/phosphoribosyl-AMP cyclohydrolase
VTVYAVDPAAVTWGPDGLVPGVVQDATDGTVLMLGWLDREALDVTLSTGEVHFHSRSRDRLWRKGETSGNVLRLVDVRLDCDGDALLLRAQPAGPTCHTGRRSCFDSDSAVPAQGFAWLESLWSAIEERGRARPAGSHTAALIAGGPEAVGRKVAEEALEVALAAKDDDVSPGDDSRRSLTGEVADLLYHALVLCAERGLPPSDVVAVLRDRAARP